MQEQIEVLILAGGRGTRLSSIVDSVPKPMAPIGKTPFLEILINAIKLQNFTNFRLLVGYKSESIINYFGDGSNFDVSIKYSHEASPLGTGGAIRNAIKDSNFNNFLVFNGDTLFEIDLNYFLKHSQNNFSIALRYVENGTRYGQIAIDDDYKITSFREKGEQPDEGYINAGVYFLNKAAVENFPSQNNFSIEQDVFPELVSKKLLVGIPIGGKFLDIGIPSDYEKAQSFLKTFKFDSRSPGLFLDRDGVINKDPGYLSAINQIEIYKEVIPLIQIANDAKIPVIVVSNQAGVARGFFSLQKCIELNEYIFNLLKKKGAIINDYQICPYHPIHGIQDYRKNSLLRKPNPGMILKSQEKFSINVEKSMMIGDKASDIIKLPGLETVLIQRNYDLENKNAQTTIFKNFEDIIPHFKKKTMLERC